MRSCARVQILFKDKSRTKQSFRGMCDINSIVEKARVGGIVNHLNGKVPLYADVSTVPDYQKALEIVQMADQSFMALDVKVRNRFENDPSRMVAFLSDPQNRKEAEELGLLEKRPETPKAEPASPPAK